MTEVLGAILAGGASQRMGRDKAMVELAGRPLVAWVADALAPVTSRVVVVGRTGPLAGLPGVPDRFPDRRGPLAGLDAAFRSSRGDVLLVGVDQPLVRAATLRRILAIDGGDAIVPVADGIPQTTCALYRGSCAPSAARLLTGSGGSLRRLIDDAETILVEPDEWRGWGEDGRSWYSIDDPSNLERAARWLEGRSPLRWPDERDAPAT